MARLEIFLLGSFHVTLDSELLTNFESDKARALLAYLAVEADRPHRREALAGLLWPDTPERTARTNLRSALANLRQVLHDHLCPKGYQAQPPYLLVTRQTIQLNSEGDYWLDVDAFRDEVGSFTSKYGMQEEKVLPSRIPELSAAVELYRGQFLAGFYVRDALLFEEWALITREALQRSALNAMHHLTEHYQETGARKQALQLAQRQVELEPYREDAHQQVMWTLALNGQRNEALVHYERFRELLQTELGVAPLEQTQEMYSRIVEGQLPGSPTADLVLRREPRVVGTCPYRGLAAFREADAPFFYGREEFTQRLVDTVIGRSEMTVIVGSSGSGKSSAVFAGLLPQLRDAGDWLLVNFRPGEQPFQGLATELLSHLEPGLPEAEGYLEAQELAEALQEGEASLFDTLQRVLEKHPSANRLLLVIDQFEELYTLCPDGNLRSRFLDTLLSLVESGTAPHHSPFSLVLTLRADFMGQALSYRPFADILNESSLILGPMNRDEFRTAIADPAEGQEAAFEPGLVTRILDDVGQEPGNLPLLEFALTLLWERLDQGWLTHAAYEEIRRVGGALARYAENVYLALNESQQEDAQQVFVQLVQPGQGTEDTRRLGSKSEFGEKRWNLIQHLADKRLVVTDQDNEGLETVEIIHEALIKEWDCLRDWVDADRAFRVWQEQMRTELHQWEDSNRDKDALLRGVSLSKAENWLIERPNDLSAAEREFIQASLHAQQERQKVENVRQERERSLERRSRVFLQVLVVVLLLATSISVGFALVARREARQANEAASLSLAANARQALNDKDTTSALMLALAANRIEQPPRGSQRILLEAAFSPGPRKLFDVTEIFEGVEGPPLSVAIIPDNLSGTGVLARTGGTTALTGFFDGTIVLWNIETGAEIHRLSGHAPGTYDPIQVVTHSGVNDIALSPSGQMAVSGGDDGLVILWDIVSRKKIRHFEGHSGAVRAVAISPDGLTVISGGLSGTSLTEPGEIILWDVRTGKENRRFEGQAEAIVDIAISPDGSRLLASSGEVDYSGAPLFQTYSLLLWDIETGELIHHFENIDRDVPSLAINPNGNFTLAASTDHNLYLWDMESREQIQAFEGHADLVRTVAFSPDGRRAISGGGDGEVILWNLEKGEVLARFNAHTAGVNDIAFSPDGRTALSVGTDGAITLWDLFNATQVNRFGGHETAVLDVAYTPDGKYFVSASGLFDPAASIVEEDSLRLWNLESGEQIGSLDWHIGDMFQMDVSPDGRRVLSGHMTDDSLRLWDIATGQEIRHLEGHMAPIFSVTFSPDGRRGLSGGIDSQIILWDLEKGTEIRRFLGSEGVIWALAVSPDGRTALSGADDRVVIWWDLETGEEIHRFAGHEEVTITGVTFSPDGKRALSGDTRGLVIEWDLEKREEIQRFAAHVGTSPVGRTRVAYLPSGLIALTSGWDGTLALWDLQTGKEIHRFRGHDTDFVFDIAISPDTLAGTGDLTALSCGTDQTIIQWQLDIPSLEELQDWIAANRYVREPTCDERELYQIEPLCVP
jgi:WD40 repeat protein/DNA-binding SARP family transcriptional activator